MAPEKDFAKFKFIAMKTPSVVGVAVIAIVLSGFASLIAGQLIKPLFVHPAFFGAGLMVVTLVPAVLINRIVPNFKTRWASFMTLVNLIIFVCAFLFFSISAEIGAIDTLVVWATLSFTLWLLTLTAISGLGISWKTVSLSMIQPVLGWLLVLASLGFPADNLIAPLALMLFGLAFSAGTLLFSDHLFSLVFYGMSGFKELSNFLKGVRGEASSLQMGHKIDALLQFLVFRKAGKENILVAPWLHSGPLREVGGGSLSTKCINRLNYNFSDSFIMHVPSNHELNPSGDVSSDILKAVKDEKRKFAPLEATQMLELEKDGLKITGQRINNTYLLFFSSPVIDDYDVSVFAGLRDKFKSKRVIFIDSHPNLPLAECHNVEPFTRDSKLVEQMVEAILLELEGLEAYPAKIGASTKLDETMSLFSMVLETEKGKILYFIADANGFSPGEKRKIKRIAERLGAKKAIIATTDTHSLSLKSLIRRDDIPDAMIESVIKGALATSGADMAYCETTLKDARILGKTYYELLTTTRILSRVIPLLYLLFLVILVVLLWIF